MASRCSSPTAALACLILAAAAAHAQGPPSDGARAAASNARAEQRIRALQKESEALAAQEKTL
ncbi:MAG: hypothetical protein ABI818_20410, partial [Acidobacteriota bacterium]